MTPTRTPSNRIVSADAERRCDAGAVTAFGEHRRSRDQRSDVGAVTTEYTAIVGVLIGIVLALTLFLATKSSRPLVLLAVIPGAFALITFVATTMSAMAYRRERRKASTEVQRLLELQLEGLTGDGAKDPPEERSTHER